MFHVLYVSAVERLMFEIKCSRLDIPHVVGFVSGHMENVEHWKWVLRYLRGTLITYSGCSVLVSGYDRSHKNARIYWVSLDKYRIRSFVVIKALCILLIV